MFGVSDESCDCFLTVEEIQDEEEEDNEENQCSSDDDVAPSGGSRLAETTIRCPVKNISSAAPPVEHPGGTARRPLPASFNCYRYQCDICRKSFKASDTLKEHRRVKHEHIVYGCPSCRLSLRSKSGFRRHVRQCHPDAVASDSPLPGRRRRHRLVDVKDCNTEEPRLPILNDRSYVGRHCLKVGLGDLVGFHPPGETSGSEAKMTMSSRDTVKPIQTTLHHMQTNDEAPISDPQPQQMFRRPELSYKDIHLKEVVPMPELRCEHCTRIFVYPKSLLTHLSKHTDGSLNSVKQRSDVYTCYFCSVEFCSEDLVAEHMAADHTETECRVCGVRCSGKVEIDAHVREQHERFKYDYVNEQHVAVPSLVEHLSPGSAEFQVKDLVPGQGCYA